MHSAYTVSPDSPIRFTEALSDADSRDKVCWAEMQMLLMDAGLKSMPFPTVWHDCGYLFLFLFFAFVPSLTSGFRESSY